MIVTDKMAGRGWVLPQHLSDQISPNIAFDRFFAVNQAKYDCVSPKIRRRAIVERDSEEVGLDNASVMRFGTTLEGRQLQGSFCPFFLSVPLAQLSTARAPPSISLAESSAAQEKASNAALPPQAGRRGFSVCRCIQVTSGEHLK